MTKGNDVLLLFDGEAAQKRRSTLAFIHLHNDYFGPRACGSVYNLVLELAAHRRSGRSQQA